MTRATARINLGMAVTPLTPRMASELDLPRTETGLVVTDVDPSGVAAKRSSAW